MKIGLYQHRAYFTQAAVAKRFFRSLHGIVGGSYPAECTKCLGGWQVSWNV